MSQKIASTITRPFAVALLVYCCCLANVENSTYSEKLLARVLSTCTCDEIIATAWTPHDDPLTIDIDLWSISKHQDTASIPKPCYISFGYFLGPDSIARNTHFASLPHLEKQSFNNLKTRITFIPLNSWHHRSWLFHRMMCVCVFPGVVEDWWDTCHRGRFSFKKWSAKQKFTNCLAPKKPGLLTKPVSRHKVFVLNMLKVLTGTCTIKKKVLWSTTLSSHMSCHITFE